MYINLIADSSVSSAPDGFVGDGKSDILWHDASTGDYQEWVTNGYQLDAGVMLGSNHVAIGDFVGAFGNHAQIALAP